ncbi:tyrosine-type recombinase/integrase [Acinetobacter stercoris]|uniref:Phage integrase family protein n=1 Tax=Acinetobacter stercoris TaxID=2126983 RepID=A0A2U3N275_9GAMM|nr:tyrosine-type recombinase/integrase [Acinetobacter stercoris]SPL71768.1 Phage integrase family protein [Acinetobacter stercoris]
MGSISQRKLADGTIRYRAEIRINRQGTIYKESKTFATMRTASNWLKKREAEIQDNPEILLGKVKNDKTTIGDLISRYLNEVGDQYSITTIRSLRVLLKLPISKIPVEKFGAMHLTEHVRLRKIGFPQLGLKDVKSSTILNELQHLKSVLNHARLLWGISVKYSEISDAMLQLRKARQISTGNSRDRLYESDELTKLLKYFTMVWERGRSVYPMHLLIMFAIFSCRRQAEITRLELKDYDKEHRVFKVRDLKNPNGSKGNHKEFVVSDEVDKIIDLALSPKYRNRMRLTECDSKYLFPLRAGSISTEFNETCALLGIEDLRFHDLRHEGATRLAEKGLTIPQIQQYTLHNTWSSLERYVSVKIRRNVLSFEEMLHLIGEM